VNSWLFTKSDQSIFVVRPGGYALTVHGPGDAHQEEDFPNEAALQAYQMSLAERLAAGGWILYGADRDRRFAERRAAGRSTPDRRRAAQFA
jgi:hypothetical protein